MLRETAITIQRANLGGLETVPDLAQVKVLINGALADVSHPQKDSIEVKALLTGDGPWMILLTSPDGKKLLCPLDLNYDPKAETFDVKQQQGLGTEEPASDDEGDKAADTIAAAIREAARALSSKTPAEREKKK